ncbi:MAG: type 4a pilus biogenesis protein PilO [Actinomycetota bacterium]|nr:type 4a pilus biogenesis protein PilO [Actinomycetota bacterium]
MIISLIGVLAAVVIGALGYFLLIGPKNAQINEKQKQIEETENKIEQEKNTYKTLLEIKNRSAEYEARLAALQAMIPEEAGLPSLIRNIQQAADAGSGAGLPWLSFSPGEIQAGGEAGGGGEISSYTFSISVAGFYDEVVDFTYRLESMQRAVVVNTIDMSPTTDVLQMSYSPNLGIVEAKIEAKTFTMAKPAAEATETPATPAPAPKEGE